jgi:membrane protease subunit HflC
VKRVLLLIVLAGAVGIGLLVAGQFGIGPVVITGEGEQKIILTLGDPRRVTQPGVALRVPLVETVRSYERRLLYLNTPPNSIQTRDQEGLVVDNYVTWRIRDPVQFFSSFPAGRGQAEPQIDQVVRAAVREVVGQNTLADVVTGRRGEIMQAITAKTNNSLGKFGIEVDDVRINRTELPKGTEENVFARMKAERERQARKLRAEGEERARRIRAESDREARVIVANARREAEIARGEGDAQAARIYAEAYDADPDFYAFVRSLEAYRKTLGEGTTLVLSPDSEFFRYLGRTPAGGGASPAR